MRRHSRTPIQNDTPWTSILDGEYEELAAEKTE